MKKKNAFREEDQGDEMVDVLKFFRNFGIIKPTKQEKMENSSDDEQCMFVDIYDKNIWASEENQDDSVDLKEKFEELKRKDRFSEGLNPTQKNFDFYEDSTVNNNFIPRQNEMKIIKTFTKYQNEHKSSLNTISTQSSLENHQESRQGVKKPSKKAKNDKENKIAVNKILRKKDKRTTIMIRNIPNKYSYLFILEDFHKMGFTDKFDFIYLPLDFVNKCNLGYAFINFVDPMHVIPFYMYIHRKKWPRFNSQKICDLNYANIQGKNNLINHFLKSSIMQMDSQEIRPIVFPTKNPIIELPMVFIL